jgi:hypothetical protein
LSPRFPILRILLGANFVTLGGCYYLIFGLQIANTDDLDLLLKAYMLGEANSGDAADSAYILATKYPESWILPSLLADRIAEWQADSQQQRFIVPAEQILYQSVLRIPAEDVEANFRGYQRLRSYQPDSTLYLDKMKYYRDLYGDY